MPPRPAPVGLSASRWQRPLFISHRWCLCQHHRRWSLPQRRWFASRRRRMCRSHPRRSAEQWLSSHPVTPGSMVGGTLGTVGTSTIVTETPKITSRAQPSATVAPDSFCPSPGGSMAVSKGKIKRLTLEIAHKLQAVHHFLSGIKRGACAALGGYQSRRIVA